MTTEKMRLDRIEELAREIQNDGAEIEDISSSGYNENDNQFAGSVSFRVKGMKSVESPFLIEDISKMIVLADSITVSPMGEYVAFALSVLSPHALEVRAKALSKLKSAVDKAMDELEQYEDELKNF